MRSFILATEMVEVQYRHFKDQISVECRTSSNGDSTRIVYISQCSYLARTHSDGSCGSKCGDSSTSC